MAFPSICHPFPVLVYLVSVKLGWENKLHKKLHMSKTLVTGEYHLIWNGFRVMQLSVEMISLTYSPKKLHYKQNYSLRQTMNE